MKKQTKKTAYWHGKKAKEAALKMLLWYGASLDEAQAILK